MYADSTVVLGPLATQAEPHSYDLCEVHAGRLTAPRGWEVVRLERPETMADQPAAEQAPQRGSDDLTRVVDAIREPPAPRHKAPDPVVQATEITRRGHLRMLRGENA
ncbi:uncharacterized protein DUF3499 [Rarobacter incanus]|uniref:Uncharacterized protein DUF3499 n=1 Tax=Rarobacter incanus TaxID=153494 RepID=A0A542SNS9_9MICO|nr:uncharacterized protein DUF3499 [Rarobacter incanus]